MDTGARPTPFVGSSVPIVIATLEGALHGFLSMEVHDGGVHLLEDRGQVDLALLFRIGQGLIRVDADDLELVRAQFVAARAAEAEADRTGDRQNDVGAFVVKVLREVCGRHRATRNCW